MQRPKSAGALALLLAAMAMIGPFTIDTYLPAFPEIQRTLQATPLEVQQSLTAYLASFSVMILWHGALSDAFGRRNIVLASLAVFALASLGCAASPSIETLWAFRVLQGVSAGAGVVVGRAIVRDLYKGAEAERMLSLVTMIFSISPAIAPVLGGWIVTLAGWRAIFLVLAGLICLLLFACWKGLPETLPPAQRQPFKPRALWNNYRQVLGSARFQLKAAAIAFNFAGFFLYVSSAPALITQILQLGPRDFGWIFIPAVAGMFVGSLAANRMAGKVKLARQIAIGYGLMLGAGLLNIGYHLAFPPAVPWSVLPLLLYTCGMSIVAPGLTLMVLDLFPAIRGTVASCQAFTMMMLSAVIAGTLAPVLSESALGLGSGQFAFGLIGFVLWRGGHWVGRRQRKESHDH